jgi:hypothetical protein
MEPTLIEFFKKLQEIKSKISCDCVKMIVTGDATNNVLRIVSSRQYLGPDNKIRRSVYAAEFTLDQLERDEFFTIDYYLTKYIGDAIVALLED